MRVTAKGKVTIPQAIREKAGLLPGTEVDLTYDGQTVQIVRADSKKAGRSAKLVAHLRGRGGGGLSTEQIMALTRR